MDREKIFTMDEAEAVILIADALAGERIHENVADFSTRNPAMAAGVHPYLCEALLNWWGVFPRRPGYRRSTEQLRAAVDAHLESAQRQFAAHLERLRRAGGEYVEGPAEPHTDTVGVIVLGDLEFHP